MESVEDSNVCFQECSSGGLICSCHKPSRWNTCQFQGTLADKAQAFLKKAEVGGARSFSHRLPHSVDTQGVVFSSFPPQTRDLEVEGLYPCEYPRYGFIVLQKCSEEPERRAGGLSMVFLIAAWEPTSRISIMKQSYSYLYCNKFPFYQMNILQEEILTKMETSWTGGLSSLQIILKTNPSAWCTSTATSRGT